MKRGLVKMKKLVLYSAQETSDDHKVNLELMRLIGKPHPRIAYIPSNFVNDSAWFHSKKKYYTQYGATLEEPVRFNTVLLESELQNLFSFDAIHLSGGDTPQFLTLLREHNLLERLRDYVTRGDVLIGMSAGAIIMTPNIFTAYDCGDDRPPEPFDHSALGLVDFVFMPHYEPELEIPCQELALELNRILYACRDGDGIVVNGDEIKLMGDVLEFKP
jgi:dipeptidase E